MELCNEKYRVVSEVEIMPPLAQYDIVHNTEKINTNDYYMVRAFRIIRNDGHCVKVALIDLICSSYVPYAVLDREFLTVILFSAIVRIDLDTGKIIQYQQCENMGGLFEIHSIGEGYLIWGEGDVFRYDRSLNRIWHFMGRDILVSLHGDKHFWLEENQIHCRDYKGWHYVLDVDGKLLENYREFEDFE